MTRQDPIVEAAARGHPPRAHRPGLLPRARWSDLPMVGPFGGLILTLPVLAVTAYVLWNVSRTIRGGPAEVLRHLLPF